ncbi:Pectate lyase superfamily protein [Lentzea fradiae]|uniref:Pectate lyase superfamily protein n=1 Tax=Lentzea fradiae TaxID=200378 RepID=A0A1G7NW77_9PSEU|nr:CARDB domain-containing protein [Lentzea fradiae]SDF78203.1 Pectate lyase superfamily protein [Lentzea fradiae]
MKSTLVRRAVSAAVVSALALFGLTPTAGAAVVRLSATLTASSTNGPYGAGNAGDGNQGSYWESTNGVFPQWLQADLGSARSVSKVVLRLPANWEQRTQTLAVQGSSNGSQFSDLSGSAARVFSPGSNNTVTLDFAATTARYVRVTVTANTGWAAAQLSEFEVHGDSGGPVDPPPPGDNLAAGKPVEESGHVHDFAAANAVDGNLGTYWESNGLPGHLTAKLGSNTDVTSVVVKLNPDSAWGARTQNFEVLGRQAGATAFATLKARADHRFDPATGNTVTIPVTGRASDVRLHFYSNTGAPGGQVAEFQVFGTSAPAPDLTVTNLTWTPQNPSEADAIRLTATVRNGGTVASGATTLNVTLGGTVAGTAQVSGLAAGATTTVTVDAGRKGAGSYPASATVDPANTVAETNEGNNTFISGSPLVVGQAPGPDLQVLGITPNPSSPAAGAQVTFAVQVNNRGTSAAGASVTRVSVGGTTLNANTSAINAGQTVTVNVGTWTATNGGATATATADATNQVAETNENNNTATQSIVVGRGASVPFTTYEAEAGRYQGTLVQADAERTFGHTNFGSESSGRKSVRLDSQGQFVEITSTVSTNSIVVRNSIPDAPGGGGQDATISLYANDQFVQKLTLSSRHSWLYGVCDPPECLTNRPGGDARRLFDETSQLLANTYPAGTKFKLQRDSGDNAQFYVIDLVDLEQVAPPAQKPAECVSITQYGATPNDQTDDADAIQRAVTADQNGEIPCVWIPEGRFRQEKKILTRQNSGGHNQVGIRNVDIRGAGMWHSQLFSLIEPQDAGTINHPHEGNFGFDIDDNTKISDIAIFGSGRIRGGDGDAEGGVGLNGRFGKNTKITNVWIEHANVGVWVGRDYTNLPELWNPGDGLLFSGMRIRNTYADGINFTNGTRNSTVFNSSFRTTGDDALAVWASKYVRDPVADAGNGNAFLNNTIALPWRANGIAIYGGSNNRAENNIISDTANYPGIMLATDHDPLPFGGTTLLANNALYRTGGAFWNEDQEFGAITLFSDNLPIPGVVIRDTEIHDSTYDGIQFKGGGQGMPNVQITNVRIDKSNNGSGILAMAAAKGSARLTNVTITNSRDGDVLVEPGSGFVIN